MDHVAYQGNFLELIKFLTENNEDINKVVLKNTLGNCKSISLKVQKEIINACAIETTNTIISDIGCQHFSLLVDEDRDALVKEQTDDVLRFVDKRRCVVEDLIGLQHVTDTSALSLKERIDDIFSKYCLGISSLRGQGYDGASNM